TDFQHKITVQASPNLDKRRSLNSSSPSPPSSPPVIPRLRAIQLTSDGSHKAWGRSTVSRHEEFEDVKRNFKKKGCTWGPNSIQMKERTDCKERIRPLSDGNSPWSTLLIKSQKTMPLASLFVDQQGACEEPELLPDGSEHRKPKQLELPGQACSDLPLWKDSPRENALEAGSWQEEAPANCVMDSPQVAPAESLSRPPQRKRTEVALLGCTALLASVALGLDVRELQAAEDRLPKEEKRKWEGIFQRASRCRTSASPAAQPPALGGEPCSPPSPPLPGAGSLFSVPSLSTKCLLQSDGEDTFMGSTAVTWDPRVPTPDVCADVPGSSHEPALLPRLETHGGVLKSPSPSFPEQSPGNVPYAASKDRASHHGQTMSEGNPFQNPTGADTIPAPGVCELPAHSSPSAHSNLPGEVSPEKHRAASTVPRPRPRPASLRTRSDPPQTLTQTVAPLPAQADHVLDHPGLSPARLLSAKERTKCHMPSLLDADVEGQSRDCTVPLCRMKNQTSRPSIYELEKEFLS
ncbi:PREDICTED: mitogen-activated protein kinase kinase kinase MLK4-like, partial [Galeopterus variegatus]|uniref:Mitogen-activated protein kinase kinase kinase MLK4-like n=1 Tax=Galeopterus variegatus TaxID=482537 RepID=A0ABM0SFU9_GALVR